MLREHGGALGLRGMRGEYGLDAHGGLERSARALLGGAAERLHLSARAFHRVLRVARTIADLEASESITAAHVAEALGYRPRTEDTMTARPVERVEALEEAATI